MRLCLGILLLVQKRSMIAMESSLCSRTYVSCKLGPSVTTKECPGF